MLLQAEQMHKMTSNPLKMVEVAILNENSCHHCGFAQLYTKLFPSQLEINHMIHQPTANNLNKWRGPELMMP